MKVKEVVLLAAAQLGIEEEVSAYFAGTDSCGKKNAELLLTCFNLVENELALDYLPLVYEETYTTETGLIYYERLEKSVVRVLEVTDIWENPLEFKIFPKYLKTQATMLKIKYSYAPEEKTIDGDSDFDGLVSKRLMAAGVATEYALAMGLFEEASVWDKKYKEAIEATRALAPYKRISSRRWV